MTQFGVKEKKMEQFRLLLAIGLSFLVLFVWSMFFVDQQPVNDNQETVTTKTTPEDEQASRKTAVSTSATISKEEVDAIKAVPGRGKSRPRNNR